MTDSISHHAGRHYGKYRGEVTGNEDDHQQGTITVKVPSVFGTELEVRARACMPFGHFFVPDVGARVWVEFEAGDLQYPLWVGAWYPEGAAPAEAQVTPPNVRVVRTPSGHTIVIDDTGGEERILIRHATDAFFSIDKDGSVLVSNNTGSHVHLDAANGSAALVEEHGNHLRMGETGTAVVNPDGTALNLGGDTLHVSAPKVLVDATSIALGAGAMEPTIMANQFSALWTVLLTHIHPSAMGPTGPSPQLVPLTLQPGVHTTSAVVVK